MKMLVKRIYLFTIALLLIMHIAEADQDPVAMLKETSQQMIDALKTNRARIKKDPSYTEILARKIILPKADVSIMARLALGREEWNNTTAEERAQFTQAFISLLVRTYAAALAAYTDETIQFLPLREDVQGSTRLQVDSIIHQRGGPQIPISYRVLKRQGQWRVYDLTVDGVSMIQSFKSQFNSYITRGGMASLLKTMEKQQQVVNKR